MRSRFALGAVAALAAAGLALTGCSGSGSSGTSTAASGAVDGTGKTLDVMIAANTLYPTQQQKWFSDVSAQFQKQTGATVKFETFASANDELTKIQTSVLSGQGPDLYDLGTTFTPTAYSTGAFVKLTDADWAKIGGRDRFIPATLGISGPTRRTRSASRSSAARSSWPTTRTCSPPPASTSRPTTWDGLAAQAKKLTSGDVHGMAIAYADSFDPWKFVWAMSMQQGNTILDLKSKKATDRRPGRREGVPDVLRLAQRRQGRRSGRDRLEERPGRRRLRGRQGRRSCRWCRRRRRSPSTSRRSRASTRTP